MTSDDTLASSNSGRAGMKKGMIRIPKLQAPKCKLIFTQHNIFHAGLTIAALLLQKMTSNKQQQYKWKSRHKQMHGLETTIFQTLSANYSLEYRATETQDNITQAEK